MNKELNKVRVRISKDVLTDGAILKLKNNNGNPTSLNKAVEKIVSEYIDNNL